VVGGSGPLGCNATVESYMSYWQQLKSGLSLLDTRLTTSDPTTLSPKRLEYRIMRALLHSIQVVLWSLPGLTQHLGALKQMVAEIWIEIALVRTNSNLFLASTYNSLRFTSMAHPSTFCVFII
jgi:hypothetical protein